MTPVSDEPVLPRNLDEMPDYLPRGAEIPDDLDPLADGILMRHQAEWLEDESPLKLCEKGRRTGITFAEALDDTLIAAAKRSAGGENVFYIGDTKDKGREFIGYVGHFGKVVAKELAQIEETVFLDQKANGTIDKIPSFVVKFASGFRVEALSSRPENIRGLQGTVCIDEAAFHSDVREVLDAVNALLLWESKIRVISTHNGVLSPFNELVREAKAGQVPFSPHFIPFQKAVDNGLYRRVCLVKGKEWTQEAQDKWIKLVRGSYGKRTAKMKQELDAIPAESEGAALTRVQIEAAMQAGIPIVRWACTDDFKNAPDHVRTADARDFCERELQPLLATLDQRRAHVFGEDFARTGHATVILPVEIGRDLVRRSCFVVELRNVPFDQQREILFYIVDRLPRLSGGALDATGNGAYLAEKAAQRYGSTVVEVKLSEAWYRTEMVAYTEAIGDRSFILPQDEDVLRDHQALTFVNGIIKVPDDHEVKGNDGFERHGDSAVAGALAHFASRSELEEYGYQRASAPVDDTGPRMFDQPAAGGLIPVTRGGLM